jgi:hypothetical protein
MFINVKIQVAGSVWRADKVLETLVEGVSSLDCRQFVTETCVANCTRTKCEEHNSAQQKWHLLTSLQPPVKTEIQYNNIHTCIHAYVRTRAREYTHTHTHAHIYIHACMVLVERENCPTPLPSACASEMPHPPPTESSLASRHYAAHYKQVRDFSRQMMGAFGRTNRWQTRQTIRRSA